MPSRGIMSEDTLREVLKKAFDFAGNDHVMLSFQGGEPLIAGKEFFVKLHQIVRELNVRRAPVHIGVQTNGTLIDEEWCSIFKRGGYLIGLSLDGDEEANRLRIGADGQPTFERVLQSAKLLQKYGVEFNSLEILKTVYLVYIENHAFVSEITDEQMRLLKKISVSLEYK